MPYKKQEQLFLREHLSSPRFFGWVTVTHLLVFCSVLLCIFTFWVPCWDVCYDFCIKPMFGTSLPPVVCRKAHVCLRLMYPLLPMSLGCLFLIATLVSSNIYSGRVLNLYESKKFQLNAIRIATGFPIFTKSEYLYAETGWENTIRAKVSQKTLIIFLI